MTDHGAHGEPPLPFFITAPGETDVLFVAMVVFTLGTILLVGVFYFYLHSLPERMAHERNHTQLQLVGILALLALFTHNDIFWVAALLLVALQLPDFLSPIRRIADALDRAAPPGLPPTEAPGTEDREAGSRHA
jgi:hypothetical protein